jgi:hypothetical protein
MRVNRLTLIKYLTEKNKVDNIIKKEVQAFKANMEEIDKKYSIVLDEYVIQLNLCMNIKIRLMSLFVLE